MRTEGEGGNEISKERVGRKERKKEKQARPNGSRGDRGRPREGKRDSDRAEETANLTRQRVPSRRWLIKFGLAYVSRRLCSRRCISSSSGEVRSCRRSTFPVLSLLLSLSLPIPPFPSLSPPLSLFLPYPFLSLPFPPYPYLSLPSLPIPTSPLFPPYPYLSCPFPPYPYLSPSFPP